MLYNGFTKFSRKTNLVAFIASHCISETILERKGDVTVLKLPTSKAFINNVKGFKNDSGVF